MARLTVLKHPHCGHSHASVTSDVDMGRVAVCNCVCCVIFRMSDVQNSGPLWTYFVILGGMECLSAYLSHGITLWAHSVREKNDL